MNPFTRRRSHLHPPQPLPQPRQSHPYERFAPVLVFIAAATAVLCIGLLVGR